MIKNQKGFSGLEVVLLVVVTALIVGGGVYVYTQRTNNEDKKAESVETNAPKPTQSAKSDDDLITESLIAFCNSSNNVNNSSVKFSNKENIGNYYRVNTGCEVPGSEGVSGFQAYLKKENNKMVFLTASQQTLGKEDGAKFGLPAAWYTTKY
jgi:uncharacterized protein (UPF0333 family)